MIELLRKRRSIRKYTDRPVEPEKMAIITEALLRTPSSRNIAPWEFIVVDDRTLLQQLATAKQHGSDFLKGAPLGIVICADSTKSDVWVEDCSIAAILAQMTALALGLGSCWIQIRNRSRKGGEASETFIKQLLAIPEHIKVECIIAIGYPAEIRQGLQASQLQQAKIKSNHY